jgi:integrase
MSCKVKTTTTGFLALQLRWNGLKSWEGTKDPDTPENHKFWEAKAVLISREMEQGTFDYLRHFPAGNKVALFQPEQDRAIAVEHTIKSYYKGWIPEQENRVSAHRLKDYGSQFRCHILPAKIDGLTVGAIYLSQLRIDHLQKLQTHLKAKGLKANSVNSVVHGSLKAMLKDARRNGALRVNLFDRDLLSSLPLTDTETSIDPYTSEERELILAAFRRQRPHFYPFVFHQFWTGCRPSEACALRRISIDLQYGWEKIEKSRVQGHEGGTKTKRSNRQIRLHDNLIEVLKTHLRFIVAPDAYAFVTVKGAPIDEDNFYKREWLPILRKLEIRPRPFYNTRHSYASFMLSCGHKLAFISAQTGDSEKTLKAHYAKWLPDVDDDMAAVEASIIKSQNKVKSRLSPQLSKLFSTPPKIKKPSISQGLKDGAGEEGRTPDLMLGKHTL